jgi:hypothetical protein
MIQNGAKERTTNISRCYLDRIAYNDELIQQVAILWSYVLLDTPPRQLESIDISQGQVDKIRKVLSEQGPLSASKLITLDMIKKLQIAGTLEECAKTAQQLISEHDINCFMLNVTSGGLKENWQLMKDTLWLLGKEVNV